MEAYFDNAATTRALDQVAEIVVETMTKDYGNASAKHRKGVEAEKYLKLAAQVISGSLKVKEKEIIFTSGGSESNNMALIGIARAYQRSGKHIITTGIEHASVFEPLTFLEGEGFEITYLPVTNEGKIRLEQLEEAIRPDTILVSIQYVNSEIGAVEPIAEIGRLIKSKNADTIFHVDAIQGYGKYHIYPKREKIDLLSMSAHKIHGPKGVGFLYMDERVKMRPLIYGGGQQRGYRSGTENIPGIAGMCAAVEYYYQNHDEIVNKMYQLKASLIRQLSALEGVVINSREGEQSAPQIVSASFEGVRSEVLLHSLEEHQIYVSSGSACSSNHPGISGTLKGIGVKKELLDSTLRFSFGIFNTIEEIDYAAGVLKEILPVLRRYRRG